MKFIRLSAKNFKSFKEAEINLDGNGFVRIEGVNNTDSFSSSVGSGKSTIADMLSYALTGETVKGNTSMSDIKNLYTDGVCRVEVEFEHNNTTYVIVRGENELSISEGGIDISKHLKRETQELIMQKFPFFTPTFIGATVIIGQNMPNAFTNNKPSARKQILEDLTNSSFMIEEIKTMLADKKTEWTSEVNNINTEIVVAGTKINSNEQTIERANSKLATLRSTADIKADLEAVTTKCDEISARLEDNRSALSELNEQKDKAQNDYAGYVTKLSDAKTTHNEEVMKALEGLLSKESNLNSELATVRADYRAKHNDVLRLEKQIEELKDAPTVCPMCKQALPHAHKIDTTAQEKEVADLEVELDKLRVRGEELSAEHTSISAEISTYKEEHKSNEEIDTLTETVEASRQLVSELSDKVSSAQRGVRDAEAELNENRTHETKLRALLSEVDTVRNSCNEDIERANAEIKKIEEERKELNEKLEKKQNRLSVLNQIISFATRDFRTILLSSIIKRLDAYAKMFCKKMLETTEIEFKDDGNNISITYRGRDFGVLSGGESQVVKMCITLALKKTLEDLVGFTTNVMFFDEVLDNCDQSTAQQIIELVSSLDLSSTFFISHHQDVYLPVDQTWVVTKTDKISELSTQF